MHVKWPISAGWPVDPPSSAHRLVIAVSRWLKPSRKVTYGILSKRVNGKSNEKHEKPTFRSVKRRWPCHFPGSQKRPHVKSHRYTFFRISKTRFLPFSGFLRIYTGVAITFEILTKNVKTVVFAFFDENVKNTGYRQVMCTPFWTLFALFAKVVNFVLFSGNF